MKEFSKCSGDKCKIRRDCLRFTRDVDASTCWCNVERGLSQNGIECDYFVDNTLKFETYCEHALYQTKN